MKNTSGIHIALGFILIISILFCSSAESGVDYRHPRVYNVEYSFELHPDPTKIDRSKDLKLWIPIPREWDSQKAVKIISIEPEPHARYVDPEHGIPMVFWDFGKLPEEPTYVATIKYRLITYKFRADIDPNQVGSYDTTSKLYTLYTRSTEHIEITPELQTLAREAVGKEKNPYLQARLIFDFVVKKMRYKHVRHDTGSGVRPLLASAVIDKQTGEKYYQGECAQMTVFFVALCRAVGIPARGITGKVGFTPWIQKEDLKLRSERYTKLSPSGFAAARIYGGLGGHRWAEFYLPSYGWIPVDANYRRFQWVNNRRFITSKGSDVLIGPNAPQRESEGYGDQWIPLHNGRADVIGWGAWNLAKVRIAKAKTLHHSDPFPADAFADYPVGPYVEDTASFNGRWILSSIDDITREKPNKVQALIQAYEKKPWLQGGQEQYICHMLRQIVGDEKFTDIYEAYIDSLVSSDGPVPTTRFQAIAEEVYGESLAWFFKQWLGRKELPELKLEDVDVRKHGERWLIHGTLHQRNQSLFRLPVEIEFEAGRKRVLKKIWLDTKKASFEFVSSNKPSRIRVDPKHHILKIQKMPPLLEDFWDVHPKMLVICGTQSEGQANRTAAERFNRDYLELEEKSIKADTDVNNTDLKTKCIFLIGRPETNKIARQFKDSFPIKFDGTRFSWQGTTYDKPTQGLGQIIENSNNAQGLIIMYAGLSPEATLKLCDLEFYDSDSSYVIFEGDKQLLAGDWEDVDSNLYWKFGSNTSTAAISNQQ